MELTRLEFDACVEKLLDEYYNFLAVSLMRGRRDRKFWDYQKRKLNEAVGFSRTRLAGAVLTRLCRAVLDPYETIQKVIDRRKHAGAAAGERVEKGGFRLRTKRPEIVL